ncbi:hypothetical protein GcM1_218057 [Golovinomyces cichoracearum]|uniref:Uncharacterized protein n=1 Tax=Golovinomyces cichoracearum TaxID=62708 RepID=A0A420ISU3_9PEZI|nr:hypothetical protein GcM1_218057 [Golovinomyces cichoracearum]
MPLHTFIERELGWLAENNYFGGRFWEDNQDYFESWTEDKLKKCEKEMLYYLRRMLVRCDFFNQRPSRRKLTNKLFSLLNEKELHSWIIEEIQALIDHGGGFIENYSPPQPKIGAKLSYHRPETNSKSDRLSQIINSVSKFQETPNSSSLESLNTCNENFNSDQDVKMEKLESCNLPPSDSSLSDNLIKQLTYPGKLHMDKDNKYDGERFDILDEKITKFRDCGKKLAQ